MLSGTYETARSTAPKRILIANTIFGRQSFSTNITSRRQLSLTATGHRLKRDRSKFRSPISKRRLAVGIDPLSVVLDRRSKELGGQLRHTAGEQPSLPVGVPTEYS